MDVNNWTQNWDVLGTIDESGGQASVKIVSRKLDSQKNPKFLKVLNRQSDDERRSRFHREVSSYQTLNHSNIPKATETNSEFYADKSYKLYLVTDYIPGKTLSKYIESEGCIDSKTAIALTLKILQIAEYCHNNDWVHRDIKPDNIILNDDNPLDPYLIDFGISFNSQDLHGFQTEVGQEIGNRFLRLPELGIGSPNKRDPRSDVTSICGILFYALTGIQPVTLLNEQNQLPHQRNDAQTALTSILYGRQLLAVFDRGFQNNISNRWNTARDLIIKLSEIISQSDTLQNLNDSASLLAQIRRDANFENYSRLQQQRNLIARALRILDELFTTTIASIDLHFDTMQRSSDSSTQNKKIYGRGIRTIDEQIEIWFWFVISVIGTELIISIRHDEAESEILRTDAENPIFDAIFQEAAKVKFLTAIRERLHPQ